ncbi:hypothetical protein MMC19_007370 [Ptychographa xylographoides]|nr:hypothetical protein [Ptychographa xylographoides]
MESNACVEELVIDVVKFCDEVEIVNEAVEIFVGEDIDNDVVDVRGLIISVVVYVGTADDNADMIIGEVGTVEHESVVDEITEDEEVGDSDVVG